MTKLNFTEIKKEIDSIVENREQEDISIKESSLYRNRMYTVIPKDYDFNLGIFPSIQQFSHKYIFLWDNPRSLLRFSPEEWMVISIDIPILEKRNLINIGSGVYAISEIPSTWKMRPEKNIMNIYVE